MSTTWKVWLVGAANATISGVTAGGASIFVGVEWHKALIIAGAAAYGSFCKWFAQHPLPGLTETPTWRHQHHNAS